MQSLLMPKGAAKKKTAVYYNKLPTLAGNRALQKSRKN